MNISIHKYLPHREPMQMVDTITHISSTNIVTEFLVKDDCIFVEENVLVEAGLIENMAQTCSAVVGQFFVSEENPLKCVIGYISAIKRLEIYSLPQVLQSVRTEAQQLSRFDSDGYSICSMQCTAYHNNTELANAEMNLFIKEMTNEEK